MSAENPWSGLFLINKPEGMTSFSLVGLIRRLTGLRKVGHTGTLDPFADGLLLVCCGKATVTARYIEALDKTYLAGIEFGRATDTQDLTGQTIAEHVLTPEERQMLSADDFAVLRRAVADMRGAADQLPPMYSAVKVRGKPLYKYARQGQVVDRKERRVHIYASDLVSAELEDKLRIKILVKCSKGTYIRTLAADLGQRLGICAHAFALTRQACGQYNIEQSIAPDQLLRLQEEIPDREALIARLTRMGCYIPLDDIFLDSSRLDLDPAQARKLIQGQKLCLSDAQVREALQTAALPGKAVAWPDISPLAIYCRQQLIALGRICAAEDGCNRIRTERVVKEIADIH